MGIKLNIQFEMVEDKLLNYVNYSVC